MRSPQISPENVFIGPPAEQERDQVLQGVERACTLWDHDGLGPAHAHVCHCAYILSEGDGLYICPNVWARLAGRP